MRIVVIRSLAELEAIQNEWQELLGSLDRQEVFQTHAWMCTWWKIFGSDDRRLFVLAVYSGQRLIGVAPFLIREMRQLGFIRSRRLELVGTGEDEVDEVCTDFGDIIAAPEHVEAICDLVWRRLNADDCVWDEARLTNVLENSVLVRQLIPFARANGYAIEPGVRRERFSVDLSAGDFSQYLQRFSPKRRKRLAYYRRRMEKAGGVVEKTLTRRQEIPLFLAEIARLNLLRRHSQGKISAFESVRFRAFHSLLAPQLWDEGALDLRLWMRGDRCVAGLYSLIYGGVIYFYQCGFDMAAFGNVSLGVVAISQMIEWGFARHHRRFDFLVGENGSYKEDYGCETAPTLNLLVYNHSLASLSLRSAVELRRLWRYGRDSVRRAVTGEPPP